MTREMRAFGTDAPGMPGMAERRAGRRYLRRHPCFVRLPWAKRDGLRGAVVWDISVNGISLLLHRPLEVTAVVEVRLVGRKDLRPLLARVVRWERHEEGWLHGCELSERLSREQLREWTD